jgi:hypothetical protein
MTTRPWRTTWILLPVGLGVILFSFFMLIPPAARESSAWLDLGVVAMVFALDFCLAMVRFSGEGGFDARAARISVRFTGALVYSVLAIAGIILGAIYLVSFNIQIVGQVICVFLFLVFHFSSCRAYDGVWSAGRQMAESRQGVSTLKTELEKVEAQFRFVQGDFAQVKQRFARLVDDARYLSPCTTEEARSIEADLQSQIQRLSALLRVTPPDLDLITALIDRSTQLMAMRRQQRHSSGAAS